MAVTPNGSEPLQPHITAILCVSDGAIQDIKTPRTIGTYPQILLPATGASTAPFGPSFRQPMVGNDIYPITFPDGYAPTGNILFPTNAPRSLVVVFNQFNGAAGDGSLILDNGNEVTGCLALPGGKPRAYGGPEGASVASGAHMLTLTADSADATGLVRLYIDDALDPAYAGGVAGPGSSSWPVISDIGGWATLGVCSLDIVYIIALDTEMSAADVARWHASLAGGGAFAPATVAGPPAAIAFVGPDIAGFSCVVGTAITPRDVSTLFSGGGTRTYSQGGAWPSWLALDAASGVISGTPTATGGVGGLTVSVADTSANPAAVSNAFGVTVSAAGGGTGSITFGPVGNNTGSGPIVSTAVAWSYFPGWRIGDPITTQPIHGSGTLDGSGQLAIGSGLPSGTSGELFYAHRNSGDAMDDDVGNERVSVA